MKKFALIAAAAASLLTVSALPANAYSMGDVVWDISSSSSWGPNQIGSFAGDNSADLPPDAPYALDDFYLDVEDPLDAGQYMPIECPANPSSITVDGDDSVLTCDEFDTKITGLDGAGEIRVFGGDYRNLIGRVTYELTNTTGTDITNGFDFFFDSEECDSGAGNIATSSGDLEFTDADTWVLCNNDNRALEGAVFGGSWITSIEYEGDNLGADEHDVYNDSLTIPAGETVTLAFFIYSTGALDHGQTHGLTDAAATSFMQNTFDPETIKSSHLWVGLDTAANWDGVDSAGGGNDLADTGTEPIGVLALGAVFLAAGVGIVARRRLTRR
jgi:hypothetical protein